MEPEKGIEWRQIALLGLVVVMGLGLTFSATRESFFSAEQQAKSDFQARAELYTDHLRRHLKAGLSAAQDVYDYYAVTRSVTREEFLLLVRTNSNLNKSRRFVSLASSVSEQRRDSFLDYIKGYYPEGYNIWNPDSIEQPVAGDAYPLSFVWAPDERVASHVAGLNIGAHPAINGFLSSLETTKTPSAVLLSPFPELDGGISSPLLMANPFISERGSQLFVIQLVDFDNLLEMIAVDIGAGKGALDLSINTHFENESLSVGFGSGHKETPGFNTPPYSEEFTLGVATWHIMVSAAPGAFPVDYGPVFVTVSVCLLLTGLFFYIVYSQLLRARRVADIVNRRTRALKEAHDELEEHYKLLQNLNKDVEEARRTAELANTAKSEFLATMSHELRTPLNAILGFSQLLREQALGPIGDDRYVEYSRDIHSSGSHLLSLINDILDLAKLEAGKINIEKNVISSRLVAERVVVLLSQQAELKGIDLQADLDDNMPDKILGDELRLRQIMINLVSNAIKFTREGSVTVRLFAKPFRDGREGYVIEVQDTGIGIPEEKQATLFDRFTQVDAALSRRHGGVGLGLAICRELVDRMEGRISVRSTLNVGTSIRVHLPLERASVDDEEDDMLI